MVQEALQLPAESTYHLEGVLQCDDEVMRMAAVVAIVSRITDSVLQVLFKNDRVPMVLSFLHASIVENLTNIEEFGCAVWQSLADLCRMPVTELVHKVIAAAWVAAGYLWERLRAATRPPWCYVSGDRNLDESLDEIVAGPRPREETSRNIWDLCALRYPRATLARGLRLLRMCGWTATPVEQAHCAASARARFHETYPAKHWQAFRC